MVERGHKLKVGGASMIGWCIANKQSRIALDVARMRRALESTAVGDALRTGSAAHQPGQAIGAMTIQSAQRCCLYPGRHYHSPDDGDQLANAIENARLFTEHKQAETALARHATQLEQTTTFLDSVVEISPS